MTCLGHGLYGPQGHCWQHYKGEYYTLVHTAYESSGPYGFGEEDFFYVFPIANLRELLTPGVGPFLTLGVCLAGFM